MRVFCFVRPLLSWTPKIVFDQWPARSLLLVHDAVFQIIWRYLALCVMPSTVRFYLCMLFSLAFARGVFLRSMSTLMAMFHIIWLFFVK